MPCLRIITWKMFKKHNKISKLYIFVRLFIWNNMEPLYWKWSLYARNGALSMSQSLRALPENRFFIVKRTYGAMYVFLLFSRHDSGQRCLLFDAAPSKSLLTATKTFLCITVRNERGQERIYKFVSLGQQKILLYKRRGKNVFYCLVQIFLMLSHRFSCRIL